MSEPTSQPVNAPGRFALASATLPIAGLAETGLPITHSESAEVPIGVLEVPIGVWGSRRVVSDLGHAERVETFSEDTCTIIVFPQGAVIRLSASIDPGQLIMVANRKSGQIILCRIVNVRSYPNVRGYAEIEFMQSTTDFWGSYAAQGTLKLTAQIQPALSQSQEHWSSGFSKEVVSILARTPHAAQIPFTENPAPSMAPVAMAFAPQLSPSERPVSSSNPRPLPITPNQRHERGIRSLWASFRGPLTIRSQSKKSPAPKRPIALIPITISLCSLAVTGIVLLHYGTAQQSGIIQTTPASEAYSPAPATPDIEMAKPGSDATTAVPQMPVAKAENFPGSRTQELADNIRVSHPSAKKPTSGKTIPNGKLLAPHFAANQSSATAQDVPPDLGAVTPNTDPGSGIQKLIATLLPPGGRAKPAQLLVRSTPIYPVAAKEAHVEGEVTVEAMIDTTGKLTGLKVVSGSPLLQEAALESLRTWKYEPAYLNGKPVPAKTSITVNFRLR